MIPSESRFSKSTPANIGFCFPEAGYKALFLSVDVPVLGKRLNEYRHEYTIPEDMSWPNILSHGGDHSDRTDYGMLGKRVHGATLS